MLDLIFKVKVSGSNPLMNMEPCIAEFQGRVVFLVPF